MTTPQHIDHSCGLAGRILPWIALFISATAAPATPLSDFLHGATPQPEAYKEPGGPEQELYCFKPAGMQPGDRKAAVVLIHGGAWVAGSAEVFFPHARYFASRGAVAFSINYRLVKPEGPFLAESLADCKSAMRYIREHAGEYGIDPSKVAVLGDSAGGHLAAALGTVPGFDDPRDDLKVSATPQAMILCNPIVDMTQGDWIKFVIAGKALDKHATAQEKTPTAEQLELGRKLSPLFNVRAGEPPTLLMHGLDDQIVTPDQAREFSAAMQKAGNRCELVLIEGARHAFVLPNYTAPEPMVVDAIRRADQFLVSLGWLTGPATLEASNPPAWVPKARKPAPAASAR